MGSGISYADPIVRPGQFQYISTTAWWRAAFGSRTSRFSYLAENIIDLWIPHERTAEWRLERSTTGRRKWLIGSPQRAVDEGFDVQDRWPSGIWQGRNGVFPGLHHDGGEFEDYRGSWQMPTSVFLASASRDPQELLASLEESSPPTTATYNGVLTYALDALRTGLVPADLRRALCETLLLAHVVEPSPAPEPTDAIPGHASFVATNSAYRVEFFIDRRLGLYLGERWLLADRSPDGLASGTEIKSVSLRYAVVDMAGDRP